MASYVRSKLKLRGASKFKESAGNVVDPAAVAAIIAISAKEESSSEDESDSLLIRASESSIQPEQSQLGVGTRSEAEGDAENDSEQLWERERNALTTQDIMPAVTLHDSQPKATGKWTHPFQGRKMRSTPPQTTLSSPTRELKPIAENSTTKPEPITPPTQTRTHIKDYLTRDRASNKPTPKQASQSLPKYRLCPYGTSLGFRGRWSANHVAVHSFALFRRHTHATVP
jgi:hypothetical protein